MCMAAAAGPPTASRAGTCAGGWHQRSVHSSAEAADNARRHAGTRGEAAEPAL